MPFRKVPPPVTRLSVRTALSAIELADDLVTADTLLDRLGELAARAYDLDARRVSDRLRAREAIGSTGFGRGVAIPHARFDRLAAPALLFVRSETPVPFAAHDGKPVDLVFGLCSPVKAGAEHLKTLAAISRFVRDDATLEKLRGAKNADAVLALLDNQHPDRRDGQQAA